MIYCKQKAFTLIELLTVLALVAIVLTLAVSSMRPLSARTATSAALQKLYTGFQLARSTAVNQRQLVTICPLDGGGSCSTDWNQPISIFFDPGNNKSLTDGNLIQVIPMPSAGSLRARPKNKQYFQFDAIGTANSIWGNITFCPPNGEAAHAGQLILSMGGRLRFAQDRNKDGIVEASNGSPISCAGA